MTVRIFSGEQLPAVEQFGTGGEKGCIIRWDYENVRIPVHSGDRRPNFRSLTARVRTPRASKQMRDSGIVAFSEARHIGIPDPERVLADIKSDMDLRYGEAPRPEIDYQFYRDALAALPEP